MLSNHPPDPLGLPLRLYAMGRCDEAVARLAAGLGKEPGNDRARLLLAELLLDSERAEEGLAVLEESPRAQTEERFLLLRGRCLLACSQAEKGEAIADRLLASDPRHAASVCLRGEVLLAGSQAGEAAKWFERAIGLDPECAAARYGLAQSRRLIDPNENVLDDLERAFRAEPIVRRYALAYHAACQRCGNLERGLHAYNELLTREPFHRRVRFLQIELLLRLERRIEAMRAVEEAIADFGFDEGLLAAALGLRNALGIKRPSGEARPSLSLCLIVKNEEEHLAQCLRSVRDFVDEIIVVDTGSKDRTADLAAIYGAQVFRVSWKEDFAAARNASLEKASGDWILVLDADEVLSPRDLPRLRELLERSPEKNIAFRVRTRNYTHAADKIGFVLNRGEYAEERGIGWFPSDKVRLFPNDPRIRFQFPVHELVEPTLEAAGILIQEAPLVVHHYGTLEEEKLAAKSEIYRRLEKSKGRDKRGRSASLREAAVQEARLGRFEQAIALWRRFVRAHPNSAEAWLNLSGCYWNTGEYGRAADCAARALRIDPRLKEAGFNLAYARILGGETLEALKILERLVVSASDYLPARFLLGVAAAVLQQDDLAAAAFAVIAQSPFGPALGEALREASKRLTAAGRGFEAGRLEKWLERFASPGEDWTLERGSDGGPRRCGAEF